MGRLYRKEQGKLLFGVCGGIADSYAIDPVFFRILFASACALTAFIPLIVVYLVLAFSLPINATPRNYFRPFKRSSKERTFGGVLSGIARYFHWPLVVLRLLFIALFFLCGALPLIASYIAFCLLTPLSTIEDEEEIEIHL